MADNDTDAQPTDSEPDTEPTITVGDVLEAQAQQVRRGGSCSNPNWTPTEYVPYVP